LYPESYLQAQIETHKQQALVRMQ